MRYLLVGLFIVVLAGCGGGGGNGGGNNNPDPVLRTAAEYFPSEIGARYVYRLEFLDVTQFAGVQGEEFTYTVQNNPLGAGQYYNLDNPDRDRGPLFDGLRFVGMLGEAGGSTQQDSSIVAGSQPQVLPDPLIGLGQVFFSNFTLQRGSGFQYQLQLSSTLAALEDVQLGGTLLRDCLRVDVQFSYNDGAFPLPAATGSYWLAPGIGPVRGVMRVAGLEVANVRLLSLDLP